jgi:RimJ/RimL family protein N-acetyltransferase
MFAPAYPVVGDRLLLRPFTTTDLDAVFAIQSREDVTRYLYWEPRTRAEVRATLAERMTQDVLTDDNTMLALAVVLRESGELIGTANLAWASVEHRQGELGYVLHPGHHRRGYGTEVCGMLLRLGFESVHMHRIVGQCDGRNVGSALVMERSGMRKEAHLRENEVVKGEWTDEIIYAMLATEWAARADTGTGDAVSRAAR